jgi:hypothetical protein
MIAADRLSGRAIRLRLPGLPFLDFFFDLDQWSKYAGMVIVSWCLWVLLSQMAVCFHLET